MICGFNMFQLISPYIIGPVPNPTQHVYWVSTSDPGSSDSAPAGGKPCRWRPVPFASSLFFWLWHKARMMMFLQMRLFRPATCCRPKSICRAPPRAPPESPKRKSYEEPMSRTSPWLSPSSSRMSRPTWPLVFVYQTSLVRKRRNPSPMWSLATAEMAIALLASQVTGPADVPSPAENKVPFTTQHSSMPTTPLCWLRHGQHPLRCNSLMGGLWPSAIATIHWTLGLTFSIVELVGKTSLMIIWSSSPLTFTKDNCSILAA